MRMEKQDKIVFTVLLTVVWIFATVTDVSLTLEEENFETIWRLIEKHYYPPLEQGLLEKKKEECRLLGVALCLDPFSYFLEPEEQQLLTSYQAGKATTVGIELVEVDGNIVIDEVLDNTHAADSGLIQAGDILVEVNGKSVAGLRAGDVSREMIGPKSSAVSFVVERGGFLRPSFSLVRDEVQVRSVTVVDVTPSILYVRIKNIFPETPQELFQKLGRRVLSEDLNLKPDVQIVLDLRRNVGGSLWASAALCGFFLQDKDDVIVTQVTGRKEEKMRITNIPLVNLMWIRLFVGIFRDIRGAVLIDHWTASGGELMGGCLRSKPSSRIIFVGERTYGKGVGQTTFHFPDRSALVLTSFEFFPGPGRMKIQGVGIEPDERVSFELNDSLKSPLFLTPQGKKPIERDAQLERAIRLVRARESHVKQNRGDAR